MGASALERTSILFVVIYKRVLSRNIDQSTSMLKNAYFLEKTVKNRLRPAPKPPHCYTSTYYYNFVEFIFQR